MYIKTPFTSTYPPTAGMMLLATIGVGDNMKALGVMTASCLYVWGREQPWGMGESHESTSLYDRECSACLTKETSWKATFDGEWMTLRTSLLPLQSHVGPLTISSTPPPLRCHHLLPLPECQASERATSPLTLSLFRHFPVDMCFLPETWSAWNNINGTVLLWSFFRKHLSLSLSFLSSLLVSLPFPFSFSNACPLLSSLAPSFDLSSL